MPISAVPVVVVEEHCRLDEGRVFVRTGAPEGIRTGCPADPAGPPDESATADLKVRPTPAGRLSA
jgi:hypothetical protein